MSRRSLPSTILLSPCVPHRWEEWKTAQPRSGSQIRRAEIEQERWRHRTLSNRSVSPTKHHLCERKSSLSRLRPLFSFQGPVHHESDAHRVMIYCSRPVTVGAVRLIALFLVQTNIWYQRSYCCISYTSADTWINHADFHFYMTWEMHWINWCYAHFVFGIIMFILWEKSILVFVTYQSYPPCSYLISIHFLSNLLSNILCLVTMVTGVLVHCCVGRSVYLFAADWDTVNTVW